LSKDFKKRKEKRKKKEKNVCLRWLRSASGLKWSEYVAGMIIVSSNPLVLDQVQSRSLEEILKHLLL
jgi:hypothetical protein